MVSMKKEVKYRILIKKDLDYFKLGTIIIQRFSGDVFYSPSQKGVQNSNYGFVRKIMDHISFHSTGRVHLKPRKGNNHIFESGDGENVPQTSKIRQKIIDTGFQELVCDTVLDYKKIPVHKKNIDNLDVVFDVSNYEGPVQFMFSMVSGRQLIKVFKGEDTPVKNISKKSMKLLLGSDTRCLGSESNNADKILQYQLFQYVGGKDELPSGRRLFIKEGSKISRD